MFWKFLRLFPDAPNASGGGGGVAPETPAAAAPASEGAAGAAPETPAAGAAAAAGGGGEAEWGSQALPEGHWARERGAQTVADIERMYRESSTESRNWKTQAETLMDKYASSLIDFTQKQKTQGAPPPGAPAGGGYFGFPSIEAYKAAMAADPQAAMRKVVQHSITADPEFAKTVRELIKPDLEPLQEQMTQAQKQAFMVRATASWSEFEKEWPEFARGKPLYAEMEKVFAEDAELQALAQRNPLKAWNLVASQLDHRVKAQQLKANETKMKETRAQASTARVGAGGGGRPASGTMAEKIRARAAAAAQEGNPVPDDVVEREIQKAENIFGYEMVHGKKAG